MTFSKPRPATSGHTISSSGGGGRALVLAAAVTVLLSGCASAAPEASGTQTPTGATSTPTPAPAVSTIVMSGTRLVAKTTAEEEIATVDFAQGTEASVAFLTTALGTAPVQFTESDIEACTTVTARYSWGDTALVLDVWEPAGFAVAFGEPSVNGIALQSSEQFAVGDNAQDFFNTLPADQAYDEYTNDSGPFVYDKVADASPWGEDNAYGGTALLQPGGIVSRIVSPETTRAFYC